MLMAQNGKIMQFGSMHRSLSLSGERTIEEANMGPSMAAWSVNLQHDRHRRENMGTFGVPCLVFLCVIDRIARLFLSSPDSFIFFPNCSRLVKCVVLGKIVTGRFR
jgi:hypothetical protein